MLRRSILGAGLALFVAFGAEGLASCGSDGNVAGSHASGGSGASGASGGTGGSGGSAADAALGGSGGQAGSLPQEIPVWSRDSLWRVKKDAAAEAPAPIVLSAARGEWESFQLALRKSGGLHGVSVSVSNLTGPAGASIPKSAVTIYREHYVYVTGSSPDYKCTNCPSGSPGWFADGLIPAVDPKTGADLTGAPLDAQPFELPSDETHAFWLDLLVPHDAVSGEYSGVVSVTSQEGTTSLPLSVQVRKFELPLVPTLKSAFLVWDSHTKETYEELLRNKLAPTSVAPSDEPELMAKLGLGLSSVGFWSGADVTTCTMKPAPSVAEIQAAVAKHAPGLFLYDYSADEIDACVGLFPTLKTWAANLHAAGVANLVTMTPNPALYDDGTGSGKPAVDIWVVLPVMYDKAPDKIQEALGLGHSVWSYNTLTQDGYSPKWEIDFSSMDYRIHPGFMNASLNLSGLLYWRTDLWSSDAWNDVDWSLSGNDYPGEALLVYPGAAVGITGVAPSIRLKWLRDGVEDFEYVALLRAKGQSAFASTTVKQVATDWKTWTRKSDELLAARTALGNELDDLSP